MSELEAQTHAVIIFRQAARYIRQYGWQEKGMGLHGQPRCSMGALASAQPGTWDPHLAKLMYFALKKELKGLSLTQFNYRSHGGEAVARLYERAAASLAAQKPSGSIYNLLVSR